ncbi:hypothetical protein NQ318_002232 [Aromia moschata]|uniref:Citrate transporter-like domain-containing protein n=1 Tax=Aromia moschata TaxID=1265417 RepID=A0AAV8Z2Z3_9CUCU|nr:hypothetical protein NQ318_002232 [Aromia moschata]
MDKEECLSEKNCKSKEKAATSQIRIIVEKATPKDKLRKASSLEVDINQSVFYTSNSDPNLKENTRETNSYGKGYTIFKEPLTNKIRIVLEGAFLPPYYGNLSTDWMCVWVQNVSEVWKIPIVTEKLIGQVPEVEYKKIFHLSYEKADNTSYNVFRLQFSTNLKANIPISMDYNLQPINPEDGIIYAALVLFGLYVLIIFDLIHRTLAAMLASTVSLAILAALNERPTMEEIFSWMDSETLVLLFSMMTLVTIFSETGVFDHGAVYAYKLTGGRMWPLINILCILTILISCFLDNVTTALLITPVTIKLCEVMNIDPRHILMYMLVFSNIGGAITPIGDPPNVIIASNQDVVESGVNFGVFTLHMGIGAILTLIVSYIQIRLTFKNISYYKFEEHAVLKNEIAVWKKTAASVGSYSRGEGAVKETLMQKTARLNTKLRNTITSDANSPINEEQYSMTLKDLEKQYPIRNKSLLVKSGITLLLVILVFFLHSIPALSRLGLGWTALLGVVLLLLLYDSQDIEAIFSRVEWSTLLFFASLFILMEIHSMFSTIMLQALSRLGLIDWIGNQTELLITSVGQESRLAVAIILILWVSATASAFVDNIPLTTMMVRIAVDLSQNGELRLPLQPLIWSLSFGACLGGNGSLFGSSSNIVCAGVAEQHGYRFTFMQFMK